MSEKREEVYQILELGKHLKNKHHKKGFGGLLFIDLSMIKFSKLSSYIRQLDKENEELKKQLENYKKLGFKHLQDKNNNLETQQKDFIKYLELEKDCFVRRCSNVYEDGLGRTRLVNEDIFNEIDNILQKYREIIGK